MCVARGVPEGTEDRKKAVRAAYGVCRSER
ncbi:hypothetical protein GA0115241_1092252 [Streptomyces sp. DpondAA-D4]|nr:hypothetical protein GA0115241_1092252 [Streptomyces sp. DpondAA-D4]